MYFDVLRGRKHQGAEDWLAFNVCSDFKLGHIPSIEDEVGVHCIVGQESIIA